MQVEWTSATPEQAAASKACIRAWLPPDVPPQHDNVLIRLKTLPFYPDLVFIEVTDLGPERDWIPPPWARNDNEPSETQSEARPSRQLYVLFEPEADRIEVLDTTNQPIYDLNKDGFLKLNRQTVLSYVSFFFASVAGPYGLMPVLEKLDIPADAEPDSETAAVIATLRPYLPPNNRIEEKDGGFEVHALLLFQRAIFKATLHVNADGIVDVKHHELALASDADHDESQAEHNP